MQHKEGPLSLPLNLFDRPPPKDAAARPTAGPPPDDPEPPVRTCPNCGAALEERKCRLFCPRSGCGYYLSCSDYY